MGDGEMDPLCRYECSASNKEYYIGNIDNRIFVVNGIHGA